MRKQHQQLFLFRRGFHGEPIYPKSAEDFELRRPFSKLGRWALEAQLGKYHFAFWWWVDEMLKRWRAACMLASRACALPGDLSPL